MKKKLTYYKVFLSDGKEKKFKTIEKTRGFGNSNFKYVTSIYKVVEIPDNLYHSERIFRKRGIEEPKDYFNNKIKLKIKK